MTLRKGFRHYLAAALPACTLILSAHATTPPPLSNPDTAPEPHLGPEYFGEVKGVAAVSAAGNATYSIPLELPPGTAGIRPALSFEYNSHMRNGLLGVGWFLRGATSLITRCPQTLAQDGRIRAVRFDEQDRFCLDGQRLVAVNGGTYGAPGTEYRTEIDSFRRIVSHGQASRPGGGPEYFTVESPDGGVSYYGADERARVEPGSLDVVAGWALHRVEDVHGNYYEVYYNGRENLGALRVNRIRYTGNDSQGLEPYAEVRFEYENRPDEHTLYSGGARLREFSKRLSAVRTYVDHDLVTAYEITYEEFGINALQAPTGNLSRIVSIGRCDAAGTCQLPLSLEWWPDHSNLEFGMQQIEVPADSTSYWQRWEYPRWHELNGDGIPDYIYTVQSGSTPQQQEITGTFEVLLSDPSAPGGWSADTWYTPQIAPHANFDAVAWGDVDGDGRTDMITPVPGEQHYRDIAIAFSTGQGFAVQTWAGYDATGDERSVHYLDMNGDYRLDLVVVREEHIERPYSDCNDDEALGIEREFSVAVALNTGSDFAAPAVWASGLHKNVDLADMDGDGLTDLVAETRYVHINHGAGFEPPVDFQSHGAEDCADPFSYAAYFHDFNADGLADRLSDGELALNTGREFVASGEAALIPVADLNGDGRNDGYTWATDTSASDPGGASVILHFNRDGYGGSASDRTLAQVDGLNRFHQLVDINGDGLYDFTGVPNFRCLAPWPHPAGTWGWCESDRLRIYLNDSPPAYLLRRVVTGLGHATAFTYRPLTDHSIYQRRVDAQLPLVDVQDATHVVASLSVPDGLGGERTTTYHYEGLKRDTSGRGSLGFAAVTVRDAVADSTEITYYSQQYPHQANPVRVETYRGSSGVLLTSEDIEYRVAGDGPPQPYVASRVGKRFDLADGALMATTTVTNTVDSFGNIVDTTTEVTDHVEYTSRTVQVVSTYSIDEQNWRLRQRTAVHRMYSVEGTHDAALDTHETTDYLPATGRPWRHRREPGAGEGLELVREFAYDGFGNLVGETVSGPGLAQRSSGSEFDARGRYPVLARNALGHETLQQWDARLGVLASERDPNGLETHYRYDGFGALVRVEPPDASAVETRRYRIQAGAQPNAITYIETNTEGASSRREFFDALGRSLGSRQRGFDGRFINSDREYDLRGRLARYSEPYFDGDAPHWNASTYDHLNRPLSLAAADPAASYLKLYVRNRVTTVDMNIHASSQWLGPLGQVLRAEDALGSTSYFEYDAAGNRIAIVNSLDSGGETRVSYIFDRLGRVRSVDDPDRGRYDYRYDALGRKIEEVTPGLAAAGRRRTFEYDLLGRLIRREEPEGASTWQFDHVANGNLGVGKLYREHFAGVERTHLHEPQQFGRLSRVRSVIDGRHYEHGYEYNSQGRLARESYPSGFAVTRHYNALGYLERLSGPGDGAVYYQVTGMDARDRLTGEWKGDGSRTELAYAGQSGRVANQRVLGDDGIVQHFQYAYDPVGSLTERRDLLHGLSETFSYDELDRLTSSSVQGAGNRRYAFDATGNMTRKDGVAQRLEYNHPRAVHAVTDVMADGVARELAYDAEGNLVAGAGEPAIDWSSYNKPTRIAGSGTTYEFGYGPDRRRYRKDRGATFTHYVNGNYEKMFAGYLWADSHYVMAGGRPVMVRATFLGATVHAYLHYDHIGSVTAMTREADGQVVQRLSYDPWGARRAATDWSSAAPQGLFRRGYTGHEHLDEFGLVHMNGRVYHARLGRMLSPDPVTQSPWHSQSYNRYSYVRNNPLKYTDPSGYACYRASAGPNGPHRYGMCLPNFAFVFSRDRRDADRQSSRYSPINRSVAANYTRTFRYIRRHVREQVGDRYDDVGNPYSTNVPTGLLTTGSLMQLVDNFSGDQDDIVDFIVNDILYGREPGIIYLTGHDLFGTNQGHLALEFTEAPGADPSTLSAGPGGSLGGSLVNTPNRGSDDPANNYTVGVVTPPPGMGAREYWQSLVTADQNYENQCCVGYDAIPGLLPGRTQYNSNSFVTGLVNATGGTTSASTYKFTGADTPVPRRFFRR